MCSRDFLQFSGEIVCLFILRHAKLLLQLLILRSRLKFVKESFSKIEITKIEDRADSEAFC